MENLLRARWLTGYWNRHDMRWVCWVRCILMWAKGSKITSRNLPRWVIGIFASIWNKRENMVSSIWYWKFLHTLYISIGYGRVLLMQYESPISHASTWIFTERWSIISTRKRCYLRNMQKNLLVVFIQLGFHQNSKNTCSNTQDAHHCNHLAMTRQLISGQIILKKTRIWASICIIKGKYCIFIRNCCDNSMQTIWW